MIKVQCWLRTCVSKRRCTILVRGAWKYTPGEERNVGLLNRQCFTDIFLQKKKNFSGVHGIYRCVSTILFLLEQKLYLLLVKAHILHNRDIMPQGWANVQLLFGICWQKKREMSCPWCVWQPDCVVSITSLLLFFVEVVISSCKPKGSNVRSYTTEPSLLRNFPGRKTRFLINCQSVTRNLRLVQHQQVF